MLASDRESWDERYLAGEFRDREPDAFVMDAHRNYLVPLLPAASAGLDLAGGAGHHAIWLAQQNWHMTLVDWSKAALEIACERAAASPIANRLEIRNGIAFEVLTQFLSHEISFGFILVSFFLDRKVLPLLPQVLLPGGLLLYRTYTMDNERLGNPRGPRNPEYLLRSQELLEIYRGMKILLYHETVVTKGVAELIAQRPPGALF